ncbi:unknown [Candidatus Colimorpha enterica]|uniref:Uncharacterized protein n=1 Tax=Candidatus Colimorpha enterica TaxID=3083063 RepID=R6TR28_9BACT|nr:unknown [Candidatus Colimorpha enterica]
MLRKRDIYDLFSAVYAVDRLCRERTPELHPREAVVGASCIRPRRFLYGEITLHGAFGFFRNADDHRLSVPVEPQLVKTRILLFQRGIVVYFVVYPAHCISGGCVGVERQLRNIHAVLEILIPHRNKLLHAVGVGVGICRVKHKEIDPRVGKHLKVLSHHPCIGGTVISEQRLTPEMMLSARTAAHVLPVALGQKRIAICGNDLVVVIRTAGSVFALPQEVENAYLSVAHAGILQGDLSAEGIGASKRAVFAGVFAGIAVGVRRELSAVLDYRVLLHRRLGFGGLCGIRDGCCARYCCCFRCSHVCLAFRFAENIGGVRSFCVC